LNWPMSFDDRDLTDQLDTLYRYALGATGDPDLAADVVQETVVRAIERREQYRSDAPLGHWLIRIAHNVAVDRFRRSSREIAVEEMEHDWHDDSYTVDAQAVTESAAVRHELLDALARLPFIYRSALLLHDVEGFRVSDIAEIAEISLPAAKQRLRRGRMAMVSALAGGQQRRHALRGVPMNCWDARQHISDYVNGDLEAATARTVERHLESCPTCPPLYASIVGVNESLGSLRDPDSVIPPALEARLRERLDPG
jgi:RNA polymerase sigma-70 factor (ECF subfamily)